MFFVYMFIVYFKKLFFWNKFIKVEFLYEMMYIFLSFYIDIYVYFVLIRGR